MLSKISSKLTAKVLGLAIQAHAAVVLAKVDKLADKSRLAVLALDSHDEFAKKVADTRQALVAEVVTAKTVFATANKAAYKEIAALPSTY